MGMVIQLTKEKKRSFQQFLEEVLRGDPKQCALWIHRISKFRGQDLGSNDKPEYLQDLEDMFREVHKTKLE